MIRTCLLSFCLAIAIALPTAVGQEGQSVERAAVSTISQAVSSESLQELEEIVEQYIDKDKAVGAELLVIQKGKTLYHESFGLSDSEDERRWKNDTLCNIRSMSKPLTSAAAQILIDRKLLKLDDPVANYLESFDNDESRSLTVRQVLTHRSGLPMTNLLHPYQYSTLAEQVAAGGKRGPQFEPGEKFWYSDLGADVVGALVEKVSGEPLHEFVKREVFDPLGMTNTLYGIDATDKRLGSAASLYLKGAKGWTRFWKPGGKPLYPFAWGSQTVYSTTTDYAKFLRMMMNGGRVGDRQLLSPQAVDRMLEPVSRTTLIGSDVAAPTGFRNLEVYYGQMMVTHHVIEKKTERPVIIGHSGSDGTNAWAWPERDLMILYFTQSRGGMTPLKIERPIDRLIIHEGKELVAEQAPKKLRPYLGTFIANYGNFDDEEFTVTVRNGKLVLDVPSQLAFELVEPDAEGLWAFALAPTQVQVEFVRDQKDQVVGLKLHQAGKIYEVPRKAIAREEDPDTATTPDKFSQRLAALDKLLEKERVRNHIPGFAIAIVKDDQIVFSKGYGVSNLDTKKPVETDTLFAIGSSTKAFTGALVAMLVDQGKMDWDDPVTKFLPDFKMNIETGDDQIRIRDLLSHRTGFNRMGVLWSSGGLTSEEVLQHAARAEPTAPFQEKFLYNNVMFMVAGRCAGRAAESDWDSLVANKIFEPLGMNSSITTLNAAQRHSRMATGYLWDTERKELVRLPMRSLDSIGPSGSIVSNVDDMAEWLRFQLAHGEFDGRRLLSREQHGETWKKQMKVSGKVDYGFGWMLRKWNRKKVVEHGGSVDGFAAQVSLLPELNAGYVLLTNVTTTPLQQDSINLVFDTLFGDSTRNAALKEIDTDSLVGNYVGSFGPYFGQTLEVSMQAGKLMFDVPSQKKFELKAPDDEGKWYFSRTTKIALSFNKDKDGRVRSITMHQGGMQPEFIREGIHLEPESPSSVTSPLLGKYRGEKKAMMVEVGVRNGRLVIDAGRSGFTMLPPDEDGKWALRARPDRLQIRFNKNDDGSIKSMTRFEIGKQVEMLRVVEADAGTDRALEELVAKIHDGYGAIANYDFAGIRMQGMGDFVNQGATGTVDLIFTKTGQHATHRDFGKMATIIEAFDGKRGFFNANVGRYEEFSGRKLKQIELRHPLWFLGDWNKDFQDISITGKSTINGQKTIVVKLSGTNVAARTLYVAADSGLIVKEDTVWIHDLLGDVPVTIAHSDFRPVNGIQLPFKTISENQFTGQFVVQFESAEVLLEIPTDAFVVPHSID